MFLRLIALALFVWFPSPPTYASPVIQSQQLVELFDLVDQDPQVKTLARESAIAALNIADVKIADAPKLDFTTKGRYPISSKLTTVQDRFSDLDERYVDGVITLSVPLTDFGRRDAETLAANARFQASELDVYLMRISVLGEILQFIVSFEESRKLSEHLEKASTHLEKRINEARLRYQVGTGTITEVRELELKSLDLRSRIMNITFERDLLSRNFVRRFNQSIDQYVDLGLAAVKQLSVIKTVRDPNLMRSQQALYAEQAALDHDRRAVERSRLPEITGTISGTLFNMDTRLGDEYDVVGGINASLPIIDSGARDSQVERIDLKVGIVEGELLRNESETLRAWDENQSKTKRVEEQRADTYIRLSEQKHELAELTRRFKSLDGKLNDIALAELALANIQSDVLEYDHELLRLRVGAHVVNESLIESLLMIQVESP